MMSITLSPFDQQWLLDLQTRFVELLELDPPEPDSALFYSGDTPSLPSFQRWLTRHYGSRTARSVEQHEAGKYLAAATAHLKNLFETDDTDEKRELDLPDGTRISLCINCFWRDLALRYSLACSGTVHILLRTDRATVHWLSAAFWQGGQAEARPDLRVVGSVQLPELLGQLATNGWVSAVRLYSEPTPGRFSLVSTLDPRRMRASLLAA